MPITVPIHRACRTPARTGSRQRRWLRRPAPTWSPSCGSTPPRPAMTFVAGRLRLSQEQCPLKDVLARFVNRSAGAPLIRA